MKETTYRCDICKQPKNEDEIAAYFFSSNEHIRIMGDVNLDEYMQHMCATCIGVLYAYKRDSIEEEQIIKKG